MKEGKKNKGNPKLGQQIERETKSWCEVVYSHEFLSVRDRPNERSSRSKVSRNVVEHHPRLLLGLESVVHAELHRDDVDGVLEESLFGDDLGDGLLEEGEENEREAKGQIDALGSDEEGKEGEERTAKQSSW